MRLILIILFIVSYAQLSAQFTYFNQINGEQGDLSSENCSNIEVVDDGYVIWGGGVNNGTLFYYIQKYDLSGNFLVENILYDCIAEYVLTGRTKSFQWNPYTQTFVFIHGVNLFGQESMTEGYLIEFDTNLDTLFTRRYNQYAPYTYPFVFRIEPDGYVVVGETGGIPYSAGTFIMKLDFDGNVLWNEIMQPLVYEDIYRNNTIVRLEDKYMIAGYGQVDYDLFGLISFVDLNGENLETFVSIDTEMERSAGFIATRLLNGEIVVNQLFSFEHYEGTSNPNIYWNLMRFGKYNEDTGAIEDQIDYFHNYDNYQMGGIKMIAGSDGGVLTLGTRPGMHFDRIAWMLKLDSNLNQEWYKEYTYETCNDCSNILYDIELAPDGGYIAAGTFTNLAVDPRPASWLLKIDACGDVAWQGCEPVGVEEPKTRIFTVYPNPTAGILMIEIPTEYENTIARITNSSGKIVFEKSGLTHRTTLNLRDFASGNYNLLLLTSEGKRIESQQIQIMR